MVICWFGIYDPAFSRNRIYMRGLRERGHTVVECRDSSPGLLKWWRLYQKHRALKGGYDVLVVGYPGHVVVPLARLISRRRVVADLLGSLSDAGEHSHHHNLWHRLKNRLIDWLAVLCAHKILLETQAQKKYFSERFGRTHKYHALYTGVDETEFYCAGGDTSKRDGFLVVFRGALKPESGLLHILKAAEFLKEDDASIRFRIIGTGYLSEAARALIVERNLTNVEFINRRVPFEELRALVCQADASLGQFESNPRLDRTIPHKAFESMHMGLSYITADTPAIQELFEDNVSAILVPPADPQALTKAIRRLATETSLAIRLAKCAKNVYNERCSAGALSVALERILSETTTRHA